LIYCFIVYTDQQVCFLLLFHVIILVYLVAFCALTLLVGRQEEHPACRNDCWHGYLSRARCKWFAYGPADATVYCCISSNSAFMVWWLNSCSWFVH